MVQDRQQQRRGGSDDAAAVELLKHPVALLENTHPNPKLTTPADLPYFEYLLRELSTKSEPAETPSISSHPFTGTA